MVHRTGLLHWTPSRGGSVGTSAWQGDRGGEAVQQLLLAPVIGRRDLAPTGARLMEEWESRGGGENWRQGV
jgi:hypothetical protein